MNWRFVRQFPKFALVLAVFVASTGLFGFWWFTRSPKRLAEHSEEHAKEKQRRAEGAAKAEIKFGKLLLIDNDLCDIDSGEVLIKGWLKGNPPARLLLEPEKKTFIAQYERAFVRYSWEGAELAKLVMRDQLAISNDYRFLLFVKEKDIWRADVDWKALKLVSERKVTNINQFMDSYFAQNLLLGSDKAIVVRNMNTQLRVNLETGEVRPGRFPLANFAKQRSPDGKMLVGVDKGAFFSYDVDSEELKTIPLGRAGILDYQWLSNSRCAVIEGGKAVKIYDRAGHALTELVALPFPCRRIEMLSPTGRFFFCTDNARGVLVDVEKKTAVQVTGGQGVTWVNDDTFFFSRDVSDSNLRGSWLQRADGGQETRFLPEPYLVGRNGAAIVAMKTAGMAVFVTGTGVTKAVVSGETAEATARPKFPSAPSRFLDIGTWEDRGQR